MKVSTAIAANTILRHFCPQADATQPLPTPEEVQAACIVVARDSVRRVVDGITPADVAAHFECAESDPDILTEATCTRCGCTDFMACPGGCSWITVDRKAKTGLCSRCATAEEIAAAKGDQP
jgi:hypothetical protein